VNTLGPAEYGVAKRNSEHSGSWEHGCAFSTQECVTETASADGYSTQVVMVMGDREGHMDRYMACPSDLTDYTVHC
jgi:hypothetical protein